MLPSLPHSNGQARSYRLYNVQHTAEAEGTFLECRPYEHTPEPPKRSHTYFDSYALHQKSQAKTKQAPLYMHGKTVSGWVGRLGKSEEASRLVEHRLSHSLTQCPEHPSRSIRTDSEPKLTRTCGRHVRRDADGFDLSVSFPSR